MMLASGQSNPAARQAEMSGDFVTAEREYEAELKVRPSAATWQRLGLVRNLQSKFDAAIPAFRQALRLDASLWTSRLFLGICLYRTNDFRAAGAELKMAARQVPPNDRGRDEIDYWLGASLIASKQPLQGLEQLERLLARKPKSADALLLASETYASLSTSLWNQVAEQNFESAAGYEVHGHALEAEGNIPGAIEAYRQSQRSSPLRSGPAAAIGRLLLQQGKPAEALVTLAEELKRHPSDPQVSYYTGLALLQQGKTAEAASPLENAVRWATLDPEPAIALAQVYLALGDQSRAAAAARRALAAAPGNTVARELLLTAEQAK